MVQKWSVVGGIFLLLLGFQAAVAAGEADDGYVMLFNGRNFDGWEITSNTDDPELLKKIFVVTDSGQLHFFADLPDKYGTKTNRSETHSLIHTQQSYDRFSLKFEYKWGTKIFNSFDYSQYDSSCCYRIFKVMIWPRAIEYQIRYDHNAKRNHTGDIWNNDSAFQWFAGADNTWLPFAEGGRPIQPRSGEHLGRGGAAFHALDGEWNQCEVIVMGSKYAIHKLNGTVVNMLTNLKHSEGTIGFQAETAEIYYRNILIKEFDEDIPADVFLE